MIEYIKARSVTPRWGGAQGGTLGVYFSFDGRFIVTGEADHKPQVRVWDLQLRTLLKNLEGHTRISLLKCVRF